MRRSRSRGGPALFADFAKTAKEVLSKDYCDDQKLVVYSRTDSGLVLGSTLVTKGALSSGGMSANYRFKNAAVDITFDAESNISTRLTATDILPSSTAIVSCKFPDYNSGKIEIQYFHEHASLTTAVGLKKTPVLDVSAAIGTTIVAFGTEARYNISSGSFKRYNAGVSLKTPSVCASAILFDKGNAVKVSCLRHLDRIKRGVVVGEISRKFSTNENTLTIGCAYEVDHRTLVKAKLNNHGHHGVLIQHELKPKSTLTISGRFNTLAMEKTPRFGLTLSHRAQTALC